MGSLMKERLKSQSLTEDLRETGEGEILRVFLRVIQVNRVLRADYSLEPLNDSTVSQSVHCTSTFHNNLSMSLMSEDICREDNRLMLMRLQ